MPSILELMKFKLMKIVVYPDTRSDSLPTLFILFVLIIFRLIFCFVSVLWDLGIADKYFSFQHAPSWDRLALVL